MGGPSAEKVFAQAALKEEMESFGTKEECDCFIVTSVLGRCGTTILRNELAKYRYIFCPVTPLQEHIYVKCNNVGVDWQAMILEQVDQDVLNKFGRNRRKSIQDIQKIVFKTPLFNILSATGAGFLRGLNFILLLREPFENVLSASDANFCKTARPVAQVLEMLRGAYLRLGAVWPDNIAAGFRHASVIEQNAIIYKISLRLTLRVCLSDYVDRLLVVKFEDWLANPVGIMGKILKFLGANEPPDKVSEFLRTSMYQRVREEGGILMSESLNGRVRRRHVCEAAGLSEKITRFLREEIIFFERLPQATDKPGLAAVLKSPEISSLDNREL